jgi:predicted enzyme related to lactoylglutathione lyase
MKRPVAIAAALLLAAPVHAQETPAASAPAPIVFFDIAGPDLASQKSFYDAVFGIKADPTGQFQVPVVGTNMPGLLRTEQMKETMVYLGVEDINATLEKVVANGGTVYSPRAVITGVVILSLIVDPAGNRVGLVEMKDGRPIVP